MLRFGMIGAGIISARHLESLEHHPNTQIQAVADLDEKKAQIAASPYGAAVYTDYKEMLENETLDAVIINLPHYLHEESTLACAQKKLHILLEKPMSISAASCHIITKACADNHVVLQIGHVQRYMPQNRRAKELIDSGSLGKLLMIEDVRTSFYFSDNRPGWFLEKNKSGGGILMNLGAHSIDKVKFLTGSGIAYAAGSCGFERPDVKVEGNAQLFMKTDSGVTVCITLCGYEDRPLDETTLYFSHGVVKLHTGKDVQIWDNGTYRDLDFTMYPTAFDAQLEDFTSSILTGSVPVTDGPYSEEIIQIIEDIYKDAYDKEEFSR